MGYQNEEKKNNNQETLQYSKVNVDLKELKKVGEGKLSSQGTGTFPHKGRAAVKWLEGDTLSYWVDPKNNHMVVVNETLNEPITVETKLFNQLLCEKFNGESQIIILEGDSNNDPLNQLTSYFREYEGYIDPENSGKGKFYMDDTVLELIDKKDKARFLKEYSRYVNDEDIPGAYVFCYHDVKPYSNKNEAYHNAVESALRSGEKVIFYGYHNIDKIINSILNKYGIDEYFYLRFKLNEDTIMKQKEPNGEEILVTTIPDWQR